MSILGSMKSQFKTRPTVTLVEKVWDQMNRIMPSSWSGGMLIKLPPTAWADAPEPSQLWVSACDLIFQDKWDRRQKAWQGQHDRFSGEFLFGFMDQGVLTTANGRTAISTRDSATAQILFNHIFNFMTSLWFRRSGSLPELWLHDWKMDTELSPANRQQDSL